VEIATVRNAMITQMKGDTALAAEFLTTQISYGLGNQIKAADILPKAIRVVQLGRGEETPEEFGGGVTWVSVPYRFHVLALFILDNDETEADGEDRSSSYDRLIRKSISKDTTLGGSVRNTELGRTFFLTHPEKSDMKLVLVEVTATSHEQSDVR